MHRIRSAIAIVLACALAGSVLAEESLEELKKQRAEIGPKRKELQAEQRKLSAEINRSKPMAKAHQAVADTKKAYDEEMASNRALKKAREAEAEAAARLKNVVAEEAGKSEDIKAANEEKSDLIAKRHRHQFEAGLLQRRLHANGSPLRTEALENKLVRATARAVREIEKDLAENPAKDVIKAREKLADARGDENERLRKIMDNRKLRKARETEREARNELREAERDDKRRAAAREARKKYNEARIEAYEDLRDAGPLLKELKKIEEESAEIKARVRVIDSLLDAHRAVLREDGPRAVKKAARKLEAAQKKYDKETDSKELKELHEKRKETWAAAEGAEIAYMKSKAPGLMAKREELWKKRDELQKLLADGKKVSKDMLKVLAELHEIGSKLGALHARANAPDYGRLRGIWSGAKAAHVAKLNSDPDIVEAKQELEKARKELDAAVEEELVDLKAVKPFLEDRTELNADLARLGFEAGIAKYQLYDAYSPLKIKVDGDRSVVKANAKWREIENDIRQDPTRAERKAREAYDEARAEVREIDKEIRQDNTYRNAYQARRDAEAALKAANAADPRNKKLADARTARDKLLEQATKSLRGARKLIEEQAELEKTRRETETAIRASDKKARDARAAIERGESKDVVKARQALSDAGEEVKKAQNSGKILELRKAHEQARKTRDAELRKLLADNKHYRALQTEIDELNKLDRKLANRIRAIEKKARQAAEREPAK